MLPLPRRFRARRSRARNAPSPRLETLEARLVFALAAGPGIAGPPVFVARPMIEVQAAPSGPSALAVAGQPQAWSASAPWGYSPEQLAAAYGFDGITFSGIAGDGSGQTVAIVDAYDDPALVDSTDPDFATSDLTMFDRHYGLPDPPSFRKLNQSGSPNNLPATDPAGAGMPGNWEEEEVLDVEWVHALAPGASIVLVECQSSSGPDLYAGARMAAGLPGVSVVSMSWGSAEFAGETAFDGSFTAPTGHPAVTFVAATGDMGAPGLYPAFSPNVIAVGGTTLTIPSGGESGWIDGGGGTSVYETEPAYQRGVQVFGKRTIPDVALDGDPRTGVSVYDSYDDTSGEGPWMKTGGTSLATPAWAALIAIADQGRLSAGGTTLAGPSQVLPALYALPAADFHDVTTGGNNVFRARSGYDESTGRGTPVAGLLAAALAYVDLAPWLGISAGPPPVVTAGQPFAITVAVENSDGGLDANFVGSVTISLGDDPGGDVLAGTLTVPVHAGYATFTGLTLTRAAAGYTIRAVSGAGRAMATTAPFAVSAAAPARFAVAATTPTNGPAGLSVMVLDAYGNLATSFAGGVTIHWSTGSAPAGPASHARHNGRSATASGGVAIFAHLGSGSTSRHRVLQASAGGISAELAIPSLTRARSRPARSAARRHDPPAGRIPAAHFRHR